MVPTKSRQWFGLLHDMLMYFNLCICSWTRTTSWMGSCRPISGSARHGISYLQVNPCWHLPKHGKCLKYSMDLWKSWPSKECNKSKREINHQYMGHVTKLWPSCYMVLLSTRQPQFRDLTHMINIIEELKEKQKKPTVSWCTCHFGRQSSFGWASGRCFLCIALYIYLLMFQVHGWDV